jgi:peptide/nickel transport system substrate-binding protein
MTLVHRGRLLFLILKTLAQKYTKSLALGFLSGLVLSLVFWRIIPFIRQQWFTPVSRIGIVGDFTPGTLPAVVQKEISGGLTSIASNGTVIPSLATSWTATDSGKTFIFTLKRDAVWHSGKPVTSADINYNIGNVDFSPIDKQTLRATLKAPYSPFPAVVSKPLFLSGLVGWGPYKVGSIRLLGDSVLSIRLVPVRATGSVREYYFYKTEAEAILAYKLGEIQTIQDLSSTGDLTGWGRTAITDTTNLNRIVSLYFNVTRGMLSDRGVRQGLAYAVPKKQGAEPADSPISKTSWAYTTKIKEYPYDLAQAKKLLSAARESSASGTLTIATFAPYLDDAEAIAASWTKVGVPTDVKVVTSVPPDYKVLLSAQDLPPDPDEYPFWHSTQTATNITNYASVKIDKLLEDGRQELDPKKRKIIYADFQRYLTEDAPAVFLYYAKSFTVDRR